MRIPRPTYANVVGTLALFVALGGSSYAAVSIKGSDVRNGSLTGTDIKNGSIKSRDVDNGSLTGSDLKNGSVTGSDIDDGSLAAADFGAGQLPAGPAGPQGPAGPAGPAGPEGPAGATNVVDRRTNVNFAPANPPDPNLQRGVASCEDGEVAVGGGASFPNILSGFVLVISGEPLESDGTPPEDGDAATAWRATGVNSSDSQGATMQVHVLCAAP